jgi:hypothetical protein
VIEAEVFTRVRERLDEDLGSDSQRYPDDTLREFMLDGSRLYVARTGCRYGTQTITVEARTLFYDLDCPVIQVERVMWDTAQAYPLQATTARSLDGDTGWWQRMTGPRSTHYFLLGLNRIALWPVSTEGGEQYVVHYQKDVYDSIAAVPVEDHEAIVNYVVARCLLTEGKPDGMSEYGQFMAVVKASARRMASADHVWRMRPTPGGVAR